MPAYNTNSSSTNQHHRRRRRRQTTDSSPSGDCSNPHSIPQQKPTLRLHLASKMMDEQPSFTWIMISAGLYVLSGVTQPILMAYAKHAGLGDAKCQLYMLFYYIGPASVAFSLRRSGGGRKRNNNAGSQYGSTSSNTNGGESSGDGGNVAVAVNEDRSWPTVPQVKVASGIALFDIFAQSIVYAGNNLAGPTIFSIIYSSVTIWAAIYSQFLLSRTLSREQWIGICLVVIGLSLTAMDSLSHGEHVFAGACLILVGSSLHAMTYVLSEKIMIDSSPMLQTTESDAMLTSTMTQQQTVKETKRISVRANCAVQGIVACVAFFIWQLIYTIPHFQTSILTPMADVGTTTTRAIGILSSISISNLIHSITFFQTLKSFPGGATSAGVLKGLQAVLVFMMSSILLCGRWGGSEMCWSTNKLLSLIVVVCGIMFYGASTKADKKRIMENVVKGGELSLREEDLNRLREVDGTCV